MRSYFADLAALAAGAADAFGAELESASRLVADAVLSERKVLAFGNGGSATQSQHFVAELVVRYLAERRALPAIALTSDIAILTACANDYDYAAVFERQVEALGRPGDVAFALTTSGKSPNVLRGLEAARRIGMSTIFITGEKGRDAARSWDVGIVVPSTETSHVQELHLAVIHLICAAVDAEVARPAAAG
jgi:D-sedoheptulose 7-phosphate isomerase